jgi:DNA-nicking Smr family endonuclease
MSAGDRPRRKLSEEERVLWTMVTKSIAPLRTSRSVEDEPVVAASAPPAPQPRRKAKVTAVPSYTPSPQAPSHAEPAPLGRRTKRRLSRNTDAIDGRLDLHGLTQAEAHDVLLRFLHSAQARGAKIVLVITGKGAIGGDAYGERGVLKRQVPMWLRLPEFRELVVGFETAGIGHGGEGALYVRVRRG